MTTTKDFFELKESAIPGAGKGVFARQEIGADAYLALKPQNTTIGVMRDRKDVPGEFLSYCIAHEGGRYLCPADFENIEPIWYLNHSLTPNAELRLDGYYSLQSIGVGEEIVIDYNTLQEPDHLKEDFYRS